MMVPGLLKKKVVNTRNLFSKLDDASGPAKEIPHDWTLAAWLEDIGVTGVIANFLFERAEERRFDDPSRSVEEDASRMPGKTEADELSKVLELVNESAKLEEVVRQRILNGVDEMTDFVVRRLLSLASRAAEPPPEPIEKFTLNEGLVSKPADNLQVYYGGLEAKLGMPDLDTYGSVEKEHTDREDSKAQFSSSTYEVITTSLAEWTFVAKPEEAGKYALEQATMPEGAKPRKPMRLDELRSRLRQFNLRLPEGATAITEIEAICARLYTGPMGVKYASVVRGYGQAIAECRGNPYTNTLHALNSFIVKASKMTKANYVYRGVVAGMLPDWFWNTKAGTYGVVEAAFMSASTDKRLALDVAGLGKASIMFEICQGMSTASKGADLGWLTQWPHEGEVVFSPFTGLEVLHTRVDDDTFVIVAKPSVNLMPATIEEILHRRLKLVRDLCDRLVLRVTRVVDESDEWGYIRELHPDGGALKLICTAMQRMMHEYCSKDPEYYNNDDALTGSMVAAVEKANEVCRWAAAIPGLVRYLPHTMPVRDLDALLRLQTLGLAHKSLDHHDAIGLCGLLVVNTQLSNVSLLYNNFTTKETSAFAQIARTRKESPLSLCGIGASQPAAKLVTETRLKAADAVLLAADIAARPLLNKLVLDENGFGVEGGVAICEALMTPPQGMDERQGLRVLSMANCGLEAKGAAAVGRVLATRHCTLTNLSIGFNRIHLEGAKAIAEALTVNVSLLSLNLHYNSLGDLGSSAIMAALASNKRSKLASLCFSSNEITPNGACEIAHAFATDSVPKLTEFDLSYNQLGMVGGMALVDAFKTNAVLQLDLTVRSCGFDLSVRSALRDMIHQREGIEIVGLDV